MHTHRVSAEFFGSQLGLSSDDLVPTMLAAAVGGVIQGAATEWFLHGGDLAAVMSEAVGILERWIRVGPSNRRDRG